MARMKQASVQTRAAAFSLLLSLHKYARWVSSLRSSRPSSAAAAGKELQQMSELKKVFPGLGRKLRTPLALHLELIGCMAAGTEKRQGRTVRSPEFLELASRQAEAVARLTAFCDGLTQAGAEATDPEAYEESAWMPCQP